MKDGACGRGARRDPRHAGGQDPSRGHTAELDDVAERFIRSRGATPTFKGYRGFPGSICASPNAMVVHGIPGPYKLSLGRCRSRSTSVSRSMAGSPTRRAHSPSVRSTRSPRTCSRGPAESLHAGVEQCRPGKRMGDVSSTIQRVAEGAGLSVIRSLVGHGIGRSMHEDPQVPNYGRPGSGPLLEEGMVLAVEPMTTAGHAGVRVGRRRLGDLLPGRLSGRALRVHGRRSRRWPAHSHPVASAPRGASRDPRARDRRERGLTGLAGLSLPGVCPDLVLGLASSPVPTSGLRSSSRSCYHAGSCSNARRMRARERIHDLVAAAMTAARAESPGPAERDHEGQTVGQADVREVQDHPPPRSGAGHLPEQAPQAAPRLGGRTWQESRASTCP